MRKYGNSPVEEGHQGANPVTGLGWELRRTAGNILAIEEELAYLREGQLVESSTVTVKRALAAELRDVIGDVDDEDEVLPARPGESYVIENRKGELNVWGELYLRERKHYSELIRLSFAVGFEKRRIELVEAQVADLNGVITGLLRALGHDPNSPEIRAVVRQQILSIMPIPA